MARSQRYLLLAQLARLALFLAATHYLGTRLTPAEFGFFALVSGLFAVAVEVLDAGTSATVARQIAQDPATERAQLAILLGWRRWVALGVASVCLASAALVAAPDWQRWVLVVAAGGLYLLHLNAYQLVFQVRQRFGRPLLLGVLLQALFLLACIAALRTLGAVLVPLLVVAREAAQVLGTRVLALRELGPPLRAVSSRRDFQTLWRVTWQFGLCALLYKLIFHAGSFSLYWQAPPEALGSYSAALRIFLPVLEVSWLLVTPLIISMSAAGAADLQRQLGAALSLHLGAAVLFCVSGLALAPVLLELLYGERYSAGALSAVIPFRWLCVTFASAMVTPVLVVAALATRREAELLGTSLAALALNLALNLWAVPAWGASGAAIACCVTEVFIMGALLLRCWRDGSWRPQAHQLLYLAPGVAMAGALAVLAPYPRAALALAVLAAPLLLAAMWRVSQRLRPPEHDPGTPLTITSTPQGTPP